MLVKHMLGARRVSLLADYLQLDPEFKATVDVIRRGEFGYEDFFSDVLDSITHGSDYYLLANDFQSYIKAQVGAVFLASRSMHLQTYNLPMIIQAAFTRMTLVQHKPKHVDRQGIKAAQQ